MANTITNLIPTLYAALDVVSRELVGFIPAVSRDSRAEAVALNETINIPVVGAITGADITPGLYAPDTGDFTPANTTMTITKSRYAPVRWNGEEQRAVVNTPGAGGGNIYNQVNTQRFTQAMRALVNEVESDLAALYSSSSRAYGTAGTAPFGTAGDLSDVAQARKILEDNGAPQNDLQMVLGGAAVANMRGKQNTLFRVNESGTQELLRNGILGNLEGFDIHNSGQVKNVVKGTGASYTSDTAGYAVGATSITLITGSGTVLAGDSVTFAGDANRYVVKTGVSAPGAIVLQEPGLRVAIPAAATALTVGSNFAANMAFSRSAVVLATRMPAMPEGGDDADDIMTITDPVSGLSFQIALYRQYRQVHFEVGLAWGAKLVAPRHCAILLG